jgi:hypothetical protein
MHVDTLKDELASEVYEGVKAFWDEWDKIEALYHDNRELKDALLEHLTNQIVYASKEQQAVILVEQLLRGEAQIEKWHKEDEVRRQESLQLVEEVNRELGTPVPAYHYLSFNEKNVVDFLRSNKRRIAKGKNPRTLQEYIDDCECSNGYRMSTSCFQVDSTENIDKVLEIPFDY